jgi:hypothetical protein
MQGIVRGVTGNIIYDRVNATTHNVSVPIHEVGELRHIRNKQIIYKPSYDR